MENNFIKFIKDPTVELFLAARADIISHEHYNPYGNHLNELTDLLDAEKYQEAIDLDDINLIMSPRAHLYKSFAQKELNNENLAELEGMIAHLIMDGIEMTGNGTFENPYLVTSVSDERDMLARWDEQFASQSLKHSGDRSFDIITTISGKEIYFDITDCYQRLAKVRPQGTSDLIQMMEQLTNNRPTKKWWQFWK